MCSPNVPRFPLWNGTQFFYILTRISSITRQHSKVFSISRKNRDTRDGIDVQNTGPVWQEGPFEGTAYRKVEWKFRGFNLALVFIEELVTREACSQSNRAPTHEGHRVTVELGAIFQEYLISTKTKQLYLFVHPCSGSTTEQISRPPHPALSAPLSAIANPANQCP